MSKGIAFVLVLAFAGIGRAEVQPTKYDIIVQRLEAIHNKYPDSTQIFELGLNDHYVKIKGLRVEGADTNGDGKVTIHNLLVATHHGNEYGSTEVAMGFAETLAQNPIDEQILFIIPVLNTQGYNAGQRWETIENVNYDPNRDYPGPCGTEGPHKLKSTKLLADFVKEQGIVVSATLHTFWPGVFYPWGIPSQDLATPYNDEYIQLANWATEESKYTVGNSTEILYPVVGAYEDWAFWANGTWSLLFEMGESHNPDQDTVAEMVKVNVPGLIRYYKNAPTEPAKDHEFRGKCDDMRLFFDLRMD